MLGNFTKEAREILARAKEEMQALNHPYVGSEHLLLSILKNDNIISRRLGDYNLTYKTFRAELINTIGKGAKQSNWFLYTPLLKRIIENAISDSRENNNGKVTIEHLFASLLEEGEGVAIRMMISLEIKIDELYNEFVIKQNKDYKFNKNKTVFIEEIGINLTKMAKEKKLDPVIGREEEIIRVIEILCRRTKNNPILIGEAGVGKTAIVEGLAQLIAAGEVPMALRNKQIISIDMASAVAGTKYRGEFEERINKIIKEAEENKDLILFIDEIHTIVGAGGAEGAIDASNIFKPSLSRGKLRCIGATTTKEFKKNIEEDKALERRFQKIIVNIPNEEVLLEILLTLKPIYEKFHSVTISEEILKEIITLSNRYIYDRNQPDKAIDILDEVCAKVNLVETKELKEYKQLKKEVEKIIMAKEEAIINNDFQGASKYKEQENEYLNKINQRELNLYKTSIKKVTKEDVANVIRAKTAIPIYEIKGDIKENINKIKTKIKTKIIGQEDVVGQLINIIKRIKLGYKIDNSCYSLLFCGSTGVGKTKLARLFGNALVGEGNVLKLDMSEYREAHSLSKILGAPPGYVGYADNQNIFEEIRLKPYSVLILDEIDKANETVINLFYQILEDGQVKDAMGRIIRFDNVIIIMTSNVGFDDYNIGFKTNDNKALTSLKERFSASFINRINNIILFNKLGEEQIKKIINKQLKDVREKYRSEGIKIRIGNEVRENILIKSDYNDLGARKIKHLIKNEVEDKIIEDLIENKTNIYIKTTV